MVKSARLMLLQPLAVFEQDETRPGPLRDGPGLADSNESLFSRRSGRGVFGCVFGFVLVGRTIAQRLVKAVAIVERLDVARAQK